MKIYLLRFFVALSAFVFGVAVFSGFRIIKKQFAAPPPASKIKESFSDAQIAQLDTAIVEQVKNIETEAEPEKEWEWDGAGEFYLAGETPPKGFKNFEFMEIITRNYEVQNETGAYGARIPPEGFIQAGKKFKFVRLSIGNRQIAFQTESIGGISYKFSGNLRNIDDDSCPIGEDSTDLKGRLVKMKDGKKIAETETGFYVSCGC
jgi:hypothetical protein